MNFLKAVQGRRTRGEKVSYIQSAAEVELRQKLTKSDLDVLFKKFSLNQVYENTEKVFT